MTAPENSTTCTVLVVDDQQPFRSAAREMFQSTPDFTVVGEATSGEQAVQLAALLRPALVLMDVRLGDIDGIEATRRIVAAVAGTLVVLVSTHRRADLPPGLTTCGALGFLRKEDVEPERLAALIADAGFAGSVVSKH